MRYNLRKERYKKALEVAGSATIAAKLAGYAEKSAAVTACKLNKLVDVQDAQSRQLRRLEDDIKARLDENYDRVDREREWLLNKLKVGVDLALYVKPDDTFHFDHKALVSVISEINKMQGNYAAQKFINHNLNTDTDLEEIKKEMAAQEEALKKNIKPY